MSEYHDLVKAIHEGSANHPQAFGDYCLELEDGLHTCVLGAVYTTLKDNIAVAFDEEIARTLVASFPFLVLPYACPEGCNYLQYCADNCLDDCYEGETWNLRILLAHLNDDHHWSREQIADWVDGLE